MSVLSYRVVVEVIIFNELRFFKLKDFTSNSRSVTALEKSYDLEIMDPNDHRRLELRRLLFF